MQFLAFVHMNRVAIGQNKIVHVVPCGVEFLAVVFQQVSPVRFAVDTIAKARRAMSIAFQFDAYTFSHFNSP